MNVDAFIARPAPAVAMPEAGRKQANTWPAPLKDAAYHGVLGEIVTALAPQTEADPAAMLVQMLAMFGNAVGRTPHFRVGADVHHLNLFVAIVGTTAKGRKGLSKGQAQQVCGCLDPDWLRDCVTGGLSSGEGLIWAVRDPITKQHPIKHKGRVTGYQTVQEDPGIGDKRLLVIETELASTLKVMTRDGNTLSAVARQAWDGQDLRTLTKTSAARATGPHISIIGHITADELRRYLEATETANGFGNRFLWTLAKRSRFLPHGGAAVQLEEKVRLLTKAVDVARRTTELRRTADANTFWEEIYEPLSTGRPGMLGALTARAEAQVMRLACLYALVDASSVVAVAHLQAALELWRYCFDSVGYLFGDRVGDPVADAILHQLRQAWPGSLSKTEISHGFGRNKPATDIDRALALLQSYRLAIAEKDRSGDGRPTERWCYLGHELNEINERSPDGPPVDSSNSSLSYPEAARGVAPRG